MVNHAWFANFTILSKASFSLRPLLLFWVDELISCLSKSNFISVFRLNERQVPFSFSYKEKTFPRSPTGYWKFHVWFIWVITSDISNKLYVTVYMPSTDGTVSLEGARKFKEECSQPQLVISKQTTPNSQLTGADTFPLIVRKLPWLILPLWR